MDHRLSDAWRVIATSGSGRPGNSSGIEFRGIDKLEFLYASARLERIEIVGDRARGA